MSGAVRLAGHKVQIRKTEIALKQESRESSSRYQARRDENQVALDLLHSMEFPQGSMALSSHLEDLEAGARHPPRRDPARVVNRGKAGQEERLFWKGPGDRGVRPLEVRAGLRAVGRFRRKVRGRFFAASLFTS